MTTIRSARATRAAFSLLDDLVEPAPTRQVPYQCPDGHTFHVGLSAEAEVVPVSWTCRTCGAAATTSLAGAVEVPVHNRRSGPSSKTPWQQLRERRSIAELEALLDERLVLLRGHGRRNSA
jgi:hypothetical protein